MSDSDRGGRDQSLEALFCALALLGIVILVYAVGQNFGVSAGRNEVTAREHYEDVKQDNLRACFRMNGVAATECVTKTIEAAQDKSDSRQDLFAQRDMANFTFWMLILSVCTFVVTGLGVWLVKRTLDTNINFLTESRNATLAMEGQVHLMQAAQRAWVVIEPEILEVIVREDGIRMITCAIHFRNNGKTVARDVKFFGCAVTKHSSDLDDTAEQMYSSLTNSPECGASSIMPNECLTLRTSVAGRVLNPKPEVSQYILILGSVGYRLENCDEIRQTVRAYFAGRGSASQFYPQPITDKDAGKLSVRDLQVVQCHSFTS
jgi:hypothetical protein